MSGMLSQLATERTLRIAQPPIEARTEAKPCTSLNIPKTFVSSSARAASTLLLWRKPPSCGYTRIVHDDRDVLALAHCVGYLGRIRDVEATGICALYSDGRWGSGGGVYLLCTSPNRLQGERFSEPVVRVCNRNHRTFELHDQNPHQHMIPVIQQATAVRLEVFIGTVCRTA